MPSALARLWELRVLGAGRGWETVSVEELDPRARVLDVYETKQGLWNPEHGQLKLRMIKQDAREDVDKFLDTHRQPAPHNRARAICVRLTGAAEKPGIDENRFTLAGVCMA